MNAEQVGDISNLHIAARATDPATSHQSMAQLKKDKARVKSTIADVVTLFEKHGPMDDHVLLDRFKRAYGEGFYSEHLPRMSRHYARKLGLVRDTGERSIAEKSGRACIVWGLGRDEAFLASGEDTCECCGRSGRLAA